MYWMLIIAVFVMIGCDKSNNVPPTITHLPVALAPYNTTTGKAGDVDFTTSPIGAPPKVFLEFNGILIDAGTGPQGTALPHLTFQLPAGTPVYAIIAGTVSSIEQNPNSTDMELHLVPTGADAYLVVYDHLQNLSVKVGDGVVGGQKLGESASNKMEVDIQTGGVAYCPADLFDPSVAATLKDALRQLMADWEKFRGDTTIYDEAGMHGVGCRTATGNP